MRARGKYIVTENGLTRPSVTMYFVTTTDALIIGFLNTPLFDVAVVLPHVTNVPIMNVPIMQDSELPLMSFGHIEGTRTLGTKGLGLLSGALEYVCSL